MQAWRAGLARLLGGLARPLQAGTTALSAIAAGVQTRADLQASITRLWDDVADQDGGDASGWLAWESAFYEPQLEAGSRVLLVGCGGGRDLLPLLQRGHAAEGLDIAPRALEACRHRLASLGLAAPLHLGSIEDATLAARFDRVIFSWLCYGYIPGERARVAALANARAHLEPAGRVLVSYVRRDPPPSRLPARLAGLAARLTGSDWTPAYGDLLLLSRSRGGAGLHFEHHFAPEEIEAEARAAGLAVAEHTVGGHGRLVLRNA
jgi:SAM-dependent methyltransferase